MNASRFRLSAIRAIFVAFVAAGALFLDAAPSAAQQGRDGGDFWDPHWMQRQIWGPRDMNPGVRQRMERHWTFMHQGIPAEYTTAHNTLPPTAGTVAAGRALYKANCGSCHGPTGMGDGEAGRALSPSPALLAYLIQRPMTVDSYLLWTISEGGKAFGTAMPAFKDTLKRDEIWKIVAFMRAGFPEGKSR